jgi:transcriptional regulator
MHTPKHFINNNIDEIKKFIKENSFGILVTLADGKLIATHIPLALSDNDTKLRGHISRANKQWQSFPTDREVLAIFSGPHAYISSSWYDHENVPTWNYIAAHVYGKIKIIESEALYESLKHMVDKYEQHSEYPVALDKMSPEYIKQSMRGIVGFEITISNIEATFKLSQNRDQKNYENIINQLEKRNDQQSNAIASMMKRTSNSIFGF